MPPAHLDSLAGLTLEQVAARAADADGIIRRIVPEAPSVAVAAFNSAI